MDVRPGLIALFGSGETAPAGRRVHEMLFRRLEPPIRVAVLETPAGFQPNSAWVAGRLAEFIEERLQNFHPQVTVVPARQRDGPYSTDDPAMAAALLEANYIFTGPGSPTYAVRHLQESRLWHTLIVRHRRGATLALASAAAIAVGAYTLPVYEIYKAGADLHWVPGLDLLGPYGLELAIVTHWDNQEGGAHLDTRCGFMGVERMHALMSLLPPTATVLGIDEHTAAVLDLSRQTVQVLGRGGVTVIRWGKEEVIPHGGSFPLDLLGAVQMPALGEGLPGEVMTTLLASERAGETPPPEVMALIEEREAARKAQDWVRADSLREQISRLGYHIKDTPQGPRWQRIPLSS